MVEKAGARNRQPCLRGVIVVGLDVLFALVAFGTVSFAWAVLPERARGVR